MSQTPIAENELMSPHIIDESEKLKLSGRDSLKVLDLLENPPPPNKRLMAVACALPKSQ